MVDGQPKKCRNYQEIKIQEQIHTLPVGSVPRAMWVVLEDDIVDSCKPGDDVIITGRFNNCFLHHCVCLVLLHNLSIAYLRPSHTSTKLSTKRLTTIGGVTFDTSVAANVSRLMFCLDQTLLDPNDDNV